MNEDEAKRARAEAAAGRFRNGHLGWGDACWFGERGDQLQRGIVDLLLTWDISEEEMRNALPGGSR